MHWNKGRGYHPFAHTTSEGILLSNTTASPLIDTISLRHITPQNLKDPKALNLPKDLTPLTSPLPTSSFRLSFRIDNRHAHPSRRYTYTDPKGNAHTRKDPPWALLLTDTQGQNYWLTVSKTEISDDIISSSPGTVVTLSLVIPLSPASPNPDSTPAAAPVEKPIASPPIPIENHITYPIETIIAQKTLKDNVLPFAGETLWNIEVSDGHLRIIAGATEPTEIVTIPIDISNLASFGFVASPAAEILISDITYQPHSNIIPTYSTRLLPQNPTTIPAAITEQINHIIEDSDDPIEGYWEIFDRTLDEALLKLGGEYKLAIVKNHDRYDIIYLDGARVNGSHWKSGMLKGILTPSSFPGLLNLEWFDSEGKSLTYSVTAQTGYNGTLTLQFPYHSSVIRLRKVQ